MRIKVDTTIFEIDDSHVKYSPYLYTLANTLISSDMDEDAHIVDVALEDMGEYVKYLQGKNFTMNESICNLFDMMGHINHMKYPPDYWKCILQDQRGYPLIELPVIRGIDIPYKYPIGKWCLYMIGQLEKPTRINIALPYVSDEIIESPYKAVRYSDKDAIPYVMPIQCEQLYFDGESVYATRQCMHCLTKKILYFEPTEYSSGYVKKLIRYHQLGYKIWMPHLNMDHVVVKHLISEVEILFRSTKIPLVYYPRITVEDPYMVIMKFARDYAYDDDSDPYRADDIIQAFTTHIKKEAVQQRALYHPLSMDAFRIGEDTHDWDAIIKHAYKHYPDGIRVILPKDPISQLFLCLQLNLHTFRSGSSSSGLFCPIEYRDRTRENIPIGDDIESIQNLYESSQYYKSYQALPAANPYSAFDAFVIDFDIDLDLGEI